MSEKQKLTKLEQKALDFIRNKTARLATYKVYDAFGFETVWALYKKGLIWMDNAPDGFIGIK